MDYSFIVSFIIHTLQYFIYFLIGVKLDLMYSAIIYLFSKSAYKFHRLKMLFIVFLIKKYKFPGRNGLVRWPAYSPDLNPLDLYFWGHMNTHVHAFMVFPSNVRA